MNEQLRLRQLAGLSTDRAVMEAGKDKFISSVKVKVEPPEGLFAKESKAKIVKWLKTNHTDLQSAMSSLNFYINRAGKNLDADRKAELESAKDDLRAAFNVKESFDANAFRRMAGLPQINIREEDAAPEASDTPSPDESTPPADSDTPPAEDEEETLPAIIKKIAKSIQGKEGEELEAALMKVYDAGVTDGKKQAEEDKETPPEDGAPEGETAEPEPEDEVTEGVKVILKGGSIGSKPSVGKEFTGDDADTKAKEYAARMNKILSPGEKSYYKMKYVVVKT